MATYYTVWPGTNYREILARGAKSDHVIAFTRGERTITVVPRLNIKRAGNWVDTSIEIPPGRWRNEFTDEDIEGRKVIVAGLLKRFPVALLWRQ